MKKRRPPIWNQPYSPRSTSIRALENCTIKTKSLHELKRRRLQRGATKLQKKSVEHGTNPSLRRDAFRSLESLFDVKKPFELSDVHSLIGCHREKYFHVKAEKFKNDKSRAEHSLLRQPVDLEPHILERNYSVLEDSYKSEPEVNEFEEKDQGVEESKLYEVEEHQSKVETDLPINMAENEEETIEEEGGDEGEDAVVETIEENDKEAVLADGSVVEGGGDDPQNFPPPYPLPPGIGEGIMKPGGRRESMLSSSPLTDTAVMNEMREADERCAAIATEIEQLKREITEIANKEDLTDEDTVTIKEKHGNILAKLAEFEKMTRKLQRLLGLADPSSFTFAKMFGMSPFPHAKSDVIIVEEPVDQQTDDKDTFVEGKVTTELEESLDKEKVLYEGDRFDVPRIEYPEDKLPRVIVCGYTENDIPKIIVADSERKGKKKCLQTLTGKLTESLTMQEKLVKENAQLEGGKYKLEEALLEKDAAVESLQRKVCGLQAEMRIVMKENTEMSRQLANLDQRVTSPTCCYTCPGGTSSAVSSPHTLRPYSYTSSYHQNDEYCRCKCCLQPQFDAFSATANNVCDGDKSAIGCATPRLAGGASRTSGCCALSGTVSQREDMCCRSPASVKPPPQRGTCPAELENKLTSYGNSTKQLEQQLGSMESEVRSMQIELANVQRERQQLEQQRKLLKCTGPCAPCACCPAPPSNLQPQSVPPYMPSAGGLSSMPPMPHAKAIPHNGSATCTGPCINAPMGASTCPQQQLRDLREQYARLQDDYKNKLCEVSCLRADTEKLKQETRDIKEEKDKMEIKMIDAEERLKILEAEKGRYEGYKEQMVEQEQALIVAKQRFREAQDELEELRSLIQDQASQLEDYRNKYLQAQQQVEEQRRQLDLMEMDNARMNENVTLEIGRVKSQFQEKLAELAPLPDILKQTQVKLQEAQQMRLVSERNCEDLSRELVGCKDKIQTLQNQLDILRNEHQALQDERGHGSGKFDELERKNSELRHENERMKNTLARFEEHEAQMQKRIDEKMHEITQLTAMLEQVREDSARQVARTKERCETVRRSMQAQIADMERQLAQCRATARAAQKDRDEIRQKMQGQINNLNEAFEQAQGRIRSLQGHVNYLKTSYSNIFKGQGETSANVLHGDTPRQGYDSCDCNY